MFQTISSFIKKHLLLVVVLISGLILVGLFHEILKPFVIAIIVAYIIEPLVKRMNRIQIRNHHIPRGVAVIVAYLLFLTALTGVGFAFIPSLTNEISQATDAVPKYFMKVKDEDIPRWSENIDKLLYKLSFKPSADTQHTINKAQKSVDDAFQAAAEEVNDEKAPDVDTSGQKPLLIHGERPPSTKDLVKAAQEAKQDEPPTIFRFKQTSKGSYDILPGDSEVVFQPADRGGYVIRINEDKDNLQSHGGFNLEKELSKAAMELVESSTKYAGSALSVLQYTISFIIETFVQIILVFMLAAFLSIDSPKLMAGIRKLFENKDGEAKTYDEFKIRMLKGLSGVVQGQIIICCINGTLTGLGLYFLGVDYSLLLGIIAGVFSIVPIFGTILSTIPAVLLGLVQGPLTALLVLGWILLVHFLDTNFFTPKIVGSSSNLHPVIIIFALLAGQHCAGVLGLILAVPVTSIVVTSIKFILENARKSEENADTIPLANIQIAQTEASAVLAVDTAITAYDTLSVAQDSAILAPEIDLPADTITSEAPEIVPNS